MDKVNFNGENVNELLEAQTHVWNHIFNFINSMSLKCAVELGIPDVIHNHGKPMSVTELVSALPTLHPSKACNIHRLMRMLVHSGFFALQKLSDDAQEEGYVPTTASPAWFENDDRTPFDTAHVKTFWDHGFHDPKLNNLFNKGLANDSRLVTTVLIEKCKGIFNGLNSLVDVGGSKGTVAKAIADAFPHLDCTVFDRPQVVAGLQDSGNLKYVGGNMFEQVPPADAVLIKWVLHDWNDDECLKILKQCKKAISSGKEGGKVIVIDIVLKKNEKVNDEVFNLIETQLFFDMVLMALLGGKEREEEEWAKLFFSAGFRDYKITPIMGMRSVIEVFP
ncbi:Trans-resveratrol di-O-methyltransferase [Hibiscus syriacus]|uniref:Trans-resveratrol di-O-methyltransferase n=1 Tax=Hibiscus syriacus TaxID=106335 RepID=A0A6A2YVA9_HIBSY|nr:Trans-resveratrol di-O-methyltransferase [Hibiscus syriacus]